MSRQIIETTQQSKASRLMTAIDTALTQGKGTQKPENAQFGFKAILQTPTVILYNTDFDMEFDIPFDDDTVANEAEFIVYNLSNSTANKFKVGNTIRMTAGYGNDTGIIFEGYISKVKTVRNGVDRVTTIYALDDVKYTPQMMDEKTYAEGTKASTILKDLLDRLGLPIEVFKTQRDHTYDDETKIDGSIVDNIKTYSDVCGVSTYIYKQRIYCRPIWDGDNLHFNINSNTGMIDSPEPFEEENTSEEYVDKVYGYEINMILQHRLTTAGIVKVDSIDYSGEYRVMSGTHSYDGLSATTKFKCMERIDTTISDDYTESGTKKSGVVNKAVSWAVDIAKDDTHKYVWGGWGPHYDCSHFVITAFEKAGVPVKSKGGATSTANMYDAFISNGFADVTSSVNLADGSGLKKGDVLLNTAKHAALVQTNKGKTVEARGSSYGIVSNVDYRNYPWNYVLRYKG